jgi:hypothetical protein
MDYDTTPLKLSYLKTGANSKRIHKRDDLFAKVYKLRLLYELNDKAL